MRTMFLLNIGHAMLQSLQSDTEQFCSLHGVHIGQNAGILLDVVAQTTTSKFLSPCLRFEIQLINSEY